VEGRFGLPTSWLLNWAAPHPDRLPELERQGYDVLRWALRQAAAELPGTTIVGFDVGRERDAAFGRVFASVRLPYLGGLRREMDAEEGRLDCLPDDDHWNRTGNQRAGELLARRLAPYLPAGVREP
jgi:hypothetical protein